jgi:hypothetical protein
MAGTYILLSRLGEWLDDTLERALEIFWDTLEPYRPTREKTSVFLTALAAIMVCLIYSAFFLNINPVELEKHSDVNNIKSSAGCQFTNVCPSQLWCLKKGELMEIIQHKDSKGLDSCF